MQKVEIYRNILEAKRDMCEQINNGWRVHTCTMGCYTVGYNGCEKILVIYERT